MGTFGSLFRYLKQISFTIFCRGVIHLSERSLKSVDLSLHQFRSILPFRFRNVSCGLQCITNQQLFCTNSAILQERTIWVEFSKRSEAASFMEACNDGVIRIEENAITAELWCSELKRQSKKQVRCVCLCKGRYYLLLSVVRFRHVSGTLPSVKRTSYVQLSVLLP